MSSTERPDRPEARGPGPAHFISTPASARDRGREFGETWTDRIQATVAAYRQMFAAARISDAAVKAETLLEATCAWAPDLGEEIIGIAQGSGLPVSDVAAINARTELLTGRSDIAECSSLVKLRGPNLAPIAAQNWDWHSTFANNWLIWEIPHRNGRRTTTLTEYGVVGKIGLNNHGVGCLFNLLHHRFDDGRRGVPVHVVARRMLDAANSVTEAIRVVSSAPVSASTAITIVGGPQAGNSAITAELWPGGPSFSKPDDDGVLVRANHFLTSPADRGDLAPATRPDSLIRHLGLRRALRKCGDHASEADVLAMLSDHDNGVCVHPVSTAAVQTLATVRLDLCSGQLHVSAGPPCESLPCSEK